MPYIIQCYDKKANYFFNYEFEQFEQFRNRLMEIRQGIGLDTGYGLIDQAIGCHIDSLGRKNRIASVTPKRNKDAYSRGI